MTGVEAAADEGPSGEARTNKIRQATQYVVRRP